LYHYHDGNLITSHIINCKNIKNNTVIYIVKYYLNEANRYQEVNLDNEICCLI